MRMDHEGEGPTEVYYILFYFYHNLVYKISVKSSFHQAPLETLVGPMICRVFAPITSFWILLIIVFLCYYITLKGSQLLKEEK